MMVRVIGRLSLKTGGAQLKNLGTSPYTVESLESWALFSKLKVI